MATNDAPGPSLLLVGVDPGLVDFRAMPGLDADRLRASRAEIDAELRALGFTVRRCVIDLGETAGTTLKAALADGDFDHVMIGAGVRAIPSNLLLFERVINIIHRHAPRAAICFNSDPSDTVDTAKRALAGEAAE
ncbi:hypothetical protein [Streptomyces sp. NPDC049879]|uniref:hypothetical protein n=1 Tax=Streptomyces sp. NPDC049879 TaxID=3365598 RepID=UPI00378CE341